MPHERVSRILPGSQEARALAVMGAQHAMSYFRHRDILGLPGSAMSANAFCAVRTVYGAFDVEGNCLGVAGVDGIEEVAVPDLRQREAARRRLVPWYAVVPAAQGRGVACVLLATMIDDAMSVAVRVRSEVLGVHTWCAQDNQAAQAVAQSIGLSLEPGRVHVTRLGFGVPERAYVRLAAEPGALDLRRRVALCPPVPAAESSPIQGVSESPTRAVARHDRVRG